MREYLPIHVVCSADIPETGWERDRDWHQAFADVKWNFVDQIGSRFEFHNNPPPMDAVLLVRCDDGYVYLSKYEPCRIYGFRFKNPFGDSGLMGVRAFALLDTGSQDPIHLFIESNAGHEPIELSPVEIAEPAKSVRPLDVIYKGL